MDIKQKMKIEIFGTGCPKCGELENRVRTAVKETGLIAEIEHVYELNKILERNIFSTPALAIDGKVLVSGKLPSVEEIQKLLKKLD